MTADLAELAKPFPANFIETKDRQSYVAHHVVNQRLLSIVGPFDFELVQVLHGDLPAVAGNAAANSRRGKAGTPAMTGIVVGAVYRLSCTIDGRRVQVEEVGDVGDVHNWPHDGARLKDAASDALKRCAMRLGLGLHLWAQEHYFLDQQLKVQAPPPATAAPAPGRELVDNLAPAVAIQRLLDEHKRTWEELAEIMTARADHDVTVAQLRGAYKAEQVQAIRDALTAHSAQLEVAS